MASKEFEFELWIDQYKAIIKKNGERPLFDDEMKKLEENIGYMPKEYQDAYNSAVGKNFQKFETLPHLLRNYLGALEMKAFRERVGEPLWLDRKEVRDYLEENAMNAALRAGISAEKNSVKTNEIAKALDSYMNHTLMKRTMMPPTESARAELGESYDADGVQRECEKNMAKQLVLAKAMLLAQIGKYDVIDKNRSGKELDVPVYETLVHGNRTNFVLPMGEASKDVLDAFMGDNNGVGAEIEKRTAATHYVKRRAIDKNGMRSSESKEERTYSPLKVFGNQYGMNIAVGGIGEKGPDRRTILGKGEAGHMYMRAEKGDAKHCGSLLIGIEGSAPGADNYLGNEHGIMAKSAKQSAFLADKAVVGKKVGGRQVDLSGIGAKELSDFLKDFSEKYTALQRNADTADGRKRLEEVNERLMGERMTMEAFAEMFGMLGMENEKNNSLVLQTRNGYLNRAKAEAVTMDRFEQSIRKSFSQEKACELAKERFARSTDLSHSVGAIKELMLTHETRGRGWKIRHPIKNHREKATITDLTKRLVSEKGFTRAQIANELLRESNSFAMDWGKGLSNDLDAIQFEQANKQRFQASEHMMQNVLKANYGDQIKEATPQKDNSEKIKEELQRVFDEREKKKEPIVIKEESEANKRAQMTSAPVSSSQKSKEHEAPKNMK